MRVTSRNTVIVTGGENRSSLAVTRSLGRYGCRVIVVGHKKKNIATGSKYCEFSYAVRSNCNDREFVKEISRIAVIENVDIVYPLTEPECLALSKYRDDLPEQIIVAVSGIDKLKKIYDKFLLFNRAKDLGVAIPATIFVNGRKDYKVKIKQVRKFPVVVKPSMSKIPVDGGYLDTKVQYAKNYKELKQLYTSNETLLYPSLIQEKIEGPGTGFFTLFDNKAHLAKFAHERLREKPPSGGVSVVCKSVSVQPEMEEYAQKLLADVDWQGVAMVEYKKDKRDGRVKLMEINGRFWGSLQLAISAGVDFPVLYHEHLLGKKIKAIENYKIGLRMKWLFGTLDYLLIRLRNSKTTLNLPSGAPGRIKTVLQFCKILERDMVFDVLSTHDPIPFLHEVTIYVRKLLRMN